MPGSLLTSPSGYTDRSKGKGIVANGWAQQVGKGSALAAGGGQISCQLSAAGIGNGADTSEDTLFTATLPANTFDVDGRCVCVQGFGNVTALSATKTVKFYFGASITQTLTWTTTQTGGWEVFAQIYRKGANIQVALIQFDAAGATIARTMNVAAGSEAEAAGIVIKITGQSTVGTANTVTANAMIIDGYN